MKGYGDIEGQIREAGRFASRLRNGHGRRRSVATALCALFVVPLGVAVVLGVAEAISRIF